MREIKFRVWTNNKMLFLNPYIKETFFNSSDLVENENWKVMQFSGENDKNKTDIYDGDLFTLGNENQVYEVRFMFGCFIGFLGDELIGIISDLKSDIITIIGNIFETPELLNKKL